MGDRAGSTEKMSCSLDGARQGLNARRGLLVYCKDCSVW